MGDGIEGRLAAIERRLALLEDERAVLASLYRYAHAIDYGDEATWVDCFTEDGAFDMRNRPDFERPGRRHEGRAALAAFIKTHTRAPAAYHKHVVVEPQITVDGDVARVRSYLFRLDESNGAPYLLVFGRYLDTMVRCDDGWWRFKERIVEIESLQFR
jgi:3-phenylpropionate/cinnamic acid dioxygenase small subunit